MPHPLLDAARWSSPHPNARSLHADVTRAEEAELGEGSVLRGELERFLGTLRAAHPAIDALLFFFRGADGSLEGFVEMWEDAPGHFRWSRLVKT